MKTMKAALALLTSLTLATFSLAGCTDSTGVLADKSPKSEDEPTKTHDPKEKAGDYTVGVIQLAQHPALDAATKGFQDTLTELVEADGGTVEFDVRNAGADVETANDIADRFVDDKVDLIMANAAPALQAATQATKTIPILGTSVTDYGATLGIDGWTGTGATGFNVSGTSDLAPLDEQAAMFKELLPEAKTVGILYCSNEANSVYQAEAMKKNLEGLGYAVEFFTVSDVNDVAAVTQSAVDKVDALYIPADNVLFDAADTIGTITEPANIPVIAGESGICSEAGVATLSIDYYELGAQTAKMAYEILVNKADPATMKIQFADTTIKQYVPARAEALGITIPDGYDALDAED